MGRILWLASYPKSGNTWTRAFLANLTSGRDAPLPLDDLTRHTPVDSERRLFARVAPGLPELLAPQQAAALRGPVQRLLAAGAKGTLMVKTHSAVMTWHGHPTFDMTATAGAVYIVRNPLDIVASYAEHSGASRAAMVRVLTTPGHVVPASAFQAPQLLGDWSQNVESWTARPHPGLHVIRYEDMTADPVAAFTALVAFLGLPFDAAGIARAIGCASFETLARLERETGFAERRPGQERFFRQGRAGAWRDELDAAEVEAIVAAHRVQMARFGYLPDGM